MFQTDSWIFYAFCPKLPFTSNQDRSFSKTCKFSVKSPSWCLSLSETEMRFLIFHQVWNASQRTFCPFSGSNHLETHFGLLWHQEDGETIAKNVLRCCELGKWLLCGVKVLMFSCAQINREGAGTGSWVRRPGTWERTQTWARRDKERRKGRGLRNARVYYDIISLASRRVKIWQDRDCRNFGQTLDPGHDSG